MIRRSGENIAAREVEFVLEQMPAVARAAVLGVPDETRKEEVKAYIVRDSQADDLSPTEVFEHCAAHLAPFKVPRYLEFRLTLPETPSGKIAKGVLRQETSDLRMNSFDRVEGVWR